MAGDAPGAPVPIKATEAEMAAGNVDMVYRDACAHLLAPLNACRRRTLYLPWKCGAERHAYELCQYEEYKRRVAAAAAPKE